MTPDRIQKLKTVWKQFSEARAIVEVRRTYVAEEAESNARAELETLLFENDALPAILDRLEGLERALIQIDGQCGNIVFNLTQATPAWEDAPKERRDELVRTAETFQMIARKALGDKP